MFLHVATMPVELRRQGGIAVETLLRSPAFSEPMTHFRRVALAFTCDLGERWHMK